MQPVDFTTLTAAWVELRQEWVPARLEQVYQRDRHTVLLGLRTFDRRGWLGLSWHPQAARFCLSNPPPRTPDTFTFSEQLRHQLNGLALVAIEPIAPWERVLDLHFARRPNDPPVWHLYVEIMGKYSNVVLVNAENVVITAAHQVSSQQSSLRPIQTGQPYEFPPRLTDATPSLDESFQQWQDRLTLIPVPLRRSLLGIYRGLSSGLVNSMAEAAALDPNQPTDQLTIEAWQRLWECWRQWLTQLDKGDFRPGWRSEGYTVLGWGSTEPVETVQRLLDRYYTDQLNQQEFSQLHHQLSQKLSNLLKKLSVKATDFRQRLQQSAGADRYREHADLLMAYSHEWQPGMKQITLTEFATGAPVTISLDPEKTAVQMAQAFYKRHQKLRRSRAAIEPLLAEVQAEIDYLEQTEVALIEVDRYHTSEDLKSLNEIREELIQQGYLDDSTHRQKSGSTEPPQFIQYKTPSGFDVLVGRNNRQNDYLTFRLAGDYDLWFHTQEIPGSHLLLRLPPGAVPEDADLQFTADRAAYHSRARQSDRVPVVYTQPQHVYKPKGAKPGIAIYKQERILWGKPAPHAT
ncbi:MAG: fibronectin/fibrinogen-binding protein [Leptolyngbyaceae cyanobacterium SL_7_1]|nr:fibronectin/fibrinogen-binding protein [Leptolyngbyaceae cyanobacterium SL_7_1]